MITALLKRAGVITSDSVGQTKRFGPFNVQNLGINWVYGESDTHYMLKNATRDRKWSVLKDDNNNNNSGEETGSEDDDNEESEEEAEMDEGNRAEMPGSSGANTGSPRDRWAQGGTFSQYDRQPLDLNWAFGGDMQEVIRRARPSTYEAWMGPTQATYDHITRVGASQERALKQTYDRQEVWNRAQAYAQQQEINHRYEDDRRRRMHDQWHAGQEVVPDPPIVDYTTLPPYDGSVTYPMPPLHHSEWINPRPEQLSQQPDQQQAQDGGLEFGAFQDTFNQIFGPPHPRYY